ncbi:hypothetical protein PV325_005862 [Microctonus aethiopoides]|uniref:Transmembrane inner ear expressed protein n=1 Tax=Microctonus aethiopoides TaxID=144406 RepID=A0AA39KYL0_9HYME|nr:hypothetical protein PV325_005862 [Microctonus aethiopoides]KAK0091285.1 hypothetical protein PV326_003460 [Microctonus aethiopoides]KAK0178437.1 hypothetical protein PV328_002385 [Microctonus aethiopoides]
MKPTITSVAPQFSSVAPCSPDEVAIRPGDCVEGEVEEWLENETLAGFRVWQLAGIILSIILAITVAFCCCIRFRIPRTKQNIEADHIRKIITQSFRKELAKISNTDMDEMDLRKALERVRIDLDAEDEELQKQRENIVIEKTHEGIRTRFHAMFYRMRTRFSENSPVQPNNVI